MKIRLVQQVFLKGKPNTFREIYKEYNSDFVARKGDYIADTAFKNPYEYEVVEVCVDYEANMCVIRLHYVELDTDNKEAAKKYIEMAKMHGWKCDME